jgi:hypothetical protein
MRLVLRLVMGSALVAAAMFATVAPTFAAPKTHDTITVSCSNGFSRTVSAHAARGVARALTNFNAYNGKGTTCAAAPGAPRANGASWLTVTCTNGFERPVNAKAANSVVKALNAYSTRKSLGVTCAAA